MLYFIKDNPQIYTYLEAQSTNELTSDYFGFSLANNVKIDKDFVLVAHQIPEKLTIGGVEFTVQQGVSFNWGPTFSLTHTTTLPNEMRVKLQNF